MANTLGLKWNKGGALARNKLGGALSSGNDGLMALIEEMNSLSDDARPIVTELFEEIGKAIADETGEAVQKAHLPAGGRFSQGETERSIIEHPNVTWHGFIAEMNIGFDYSKQGAGGFLITGTPRMRPDRALEKIYVQKAAIQRRKNEIVKKFYDRLMDMRGG